MPYFLLLKIWQKGSPLGPVRGWSKHGLKVVRKINQRIKQLRTYMENNKLDAFLISKAENIRYLSGFTGGSDGKLLLSAEHKYIITDSRYYEQVVRECPEWELIKNNTAGNKTLIDLCDRYKRIAVEAHYMVLDIYNSLTKQSKAEFVALSSIVESFRIVKDAKELELMRTAAHIGDQVFTQICREIRAGLRERDIANRITYLIKDGGCSKESFDTIAVAGENAALPHGQPGDKQLQTGDMLTLDFGGFYKGYASDMTRTVMINNASQKLKDIYLWLLEAQQVGVSHVKAGASGKEIDAKVRECLHKHDLDKYFQHGLGHGVGLEIHEGPRLSPLSDSILEENMVVTVEPGVYIPAWGGIRIEDTVIVKKDACEIITHSNKDLLIL